jgi:hypothetical protein
VKLYYLQGDERQVTRQFLSGHQVIRAAFKRWVHQRSSQNGLAPAAKTAITANVGAKDANGIPVAADPGFVFMNQAMANVMAAIKGEAALVLLKLPLIALQLLFIGADVSRGSGLAKSQGS